MSTLSGAARSCLIWQHSEYLRAAKSKRAFLLLALKMKDAPFEVRHIRFSISLEVPRRLRRSR